MSNPKTKLEEHLKRIESGTVTSVSELESQGMIALIRTVLESSGISSQFNLLKMYCDWAVHPELDRSKSAQELLALANKSLRLNLSVEAGGTIGQDVSQALSLKRLRTELGQFLTSQNLSTILTYENQNWQSIRGSWLSLLLGRKIVLPDRPTQSLKQELDNFKTSHGMWVCSLEFQKGQNDIALIAMGIDGKKPVTICTPIAEA